jgi:hypothetical protein
MGGARGPETKKSGLAMLWEGLIKADSQTWVAQFGAWGKEKKL